MTTPRRSPWLSPPPHLRATNSRPFAIGSTGKGHPSPKLLFRMTIEAACFRGGPVCSPTGAAQPREVTRPDQHRPRVAARPRLMSDRGHPRRPVVSVRGHSHPPLARSNSQMPSRRIPCLPPSSRNRSRRLRSACGPTLSPPPAGGHGPCHTRSNREPDGRGRGGWAYPTCLCWHITGQWDLRRKPFRLRGRAILPLRLPALPAPSMWRG